MRRQAGKRQGHDLTGATDPMEGEVRLRLARRDRHRRRQPVVSGGVFGPCPRDLRDDNRHNGFPHPRLTNHDRDRFGLALYDLVERRPERDRHLRRVVVLYRQQSGLDRYGRRVRFAAKLNRLIRLHLQVVENHHRDDSLAAIRTSRNLDLQGSR